MELRSYQKQAVHHALIDLDKGANPLLVLPTGSGKSLIIAELCKVLNKQILVITPRVKLLEQNSRLILGTGILSGNRGYDTGAHHSVICGTYQTLIRRDFETPEIVIIDEAHLVPEDDSEYTALLNRFTDAQFIGLTATPFRGHKRIYGDIKQRWRKSFEVNLISLIEKGYLVPPRAFKTSVEIDREHRSNEEITQEILPVAIEKLTQLQRQKTLVFCKSIEHAELVTDELLQLGETVLCIHSNMTQKEHDYIYQSFTQDNERCWLVNCNMLTTGVDLPSVDSIVILRKIQEGGLYIQIIGRGLRNAINKDYCAVLDYGKNSSRFGLLDNPKFLRDFQRQGGSTSVKERHCPNCELLISNQAKQCCHCGFYFDLKPTIEITSLGTPLLSVDVRQSRIDSIETELVSKGCIKVVYKLLNGDKVYRFVAQNNKDTIFDTSAIVMYRASKGLNRFHSIKNKAD
ncbi:DEAD/DEAH box helicase family protein [Shewanella frigidimarina]|uniref:DEAD/DEAH box helicase n=1 Tax=Shewanella frigidimarina TaxID=56812 RepID=UPI003D7BB397